MTFSITGSLKFGWEKIRAHSQIVFLTVVILTILQFVLNFSTSRNKADLVYLPVFITTLILEIILSIGATIIVLKLSRGEHAELRELIPPGRLLWQYTAASATVAVLACAGIVGPFLVGIFAGVIFYYVGLPGIVVFAPIILGVIVGSVAAIWIVLRYFFVKIAAIDGVHPIKKILTDSAKLSDGIKWQLVLFLLVIALINIAGAITIVGLLLSIPITMFAMTHVYLKMLGKKH